MSRITTKKAPTRCTTCKRSIRTAKADQTAKNMLCDVKVCDFINEIKAAIEEKNRINITPKKRSDLKVFEKKKNNIQIVRKK